jgi:hypothetical protein
MSEQKNKDFAFGKENYVLVLAGLALIALGFFLMAGGGSEDPNVLAKRSLAREGLLLHRL